MTDHGSTSPPPPPGVGRTLVRGFGELLVTCGVLLLLLAIYQLFWTNVTSAAAIASERSTLEAQWAAAPPPAPSGSWTPPVVTEPAYGKAFALVYIPRLRDKVWALPVLQGTGKDVLATGAGHYGGTAMPGGVGNFAIAAHRSTHDEPFANFPDLTTGDAVVIRTQAAWFTYRLVRDDAEVAPTDVWVIDPVPGKPGATPQERLITLTTCTPRYGSTGRWAWWGTLVAVTPASGPAPAAVGTKA